MLTRNEILTRAIHDCYKEMYAKAQPSGDWDQIVQEFKDGKRNKDERVYEQYYLSQEEFTYIVDKYLDAYNIKEQWKDNVKVVEDYLNNGGVKDKYIPDEYDENGELVSMGHRGYEKVPPIKEQIRKIIDSYLENTELNQTRQDLTNDIADKVMEIISTCKNFYQFDKEESQFRITTALGASPTSNPEIVKRYWKEKTGEDIEIEERNPKLFWYRDEGYTDDDLAEEFEDLGPNWKEKLDKEWKDEIEAKKHEQEERIKKLKEEYNKNNKENDKG